MATLRVPLWVEMKGRRVLVVGGGVVGTRRALKFLRAGAQVKVVALEFREELVEEASRNPKLELVKLDATREELLEPLVEWADLVVVATSSSEANEVVWRLARKHRRLVNDATDASRTEVVVPYEGEVRGIRFAVTTEGKSGVAARWARDRIARCLEGDRALMTLYEAMSRIKPLLKKLVPSPRDRLPLYFEIEEDPVFREAVERGDLVAALSRAAELVCVKAERLGIRVSPSKVLEDLKRQPPS